MSAKKRNPSCKHKAIWINADNNSGHCINCRQFMAKCIDGKWRPVNGKTIGDGESNIDYGEHD